MAGSVADSGAGSVEIARAVVQRPDRAAGAAVDATEAPPGSFPALVAERVMEGEGPGSFDRTRSLGLRGSVWPPCLGRKLGPARLRLHPD
jgi:hypothetical protein